MKGTILDIDVSECKYYQMAHCPEGYTCKYHCCDCYYKQLQQVTVENEELKERASFINADRCAEIMRYKKCLDEIEEICKNSYTTEQQYYYRTSDTILQKIKEVKENE